MINLASAADFTKESLLVEIAKMKEFLLDDTKTVQFFKTYINPAQLKEAGKNDSDIVAMAEEFNGNDKKPIIINVLSNVDPSTLIVDDEKKIISAPTKISGGRPIIFQFVDGHWYFSNK